MERKPRIRDLQKAAMSKNWDFVDKAIPQVVSDRRYSSWAFRHGIDSAFEPIRDLAVAILEKAPIQEERFKEMREPLYKLMTKDRVSYAGFRAACALAAHGAKGYVQEVREMLKKFTKDKDVREIAENYLNKLD